MKQYATLEDTVYFWFAGNDTSGSGGDGASPAADIRLAGAAVDAVPVLSPTPVLLTHVNYPAGCYELAVAATAANGFAANNTYAVFCTLLIDSQNPTGFIGSFDLKPVESNLKQLGDSAQSATDLKDFADAGYDPATNKVEGAKLVDTTTANSDMRGTDSAALASVCTEVRLAELAAANIPTDIDTLLGRITAAVALASVCTEARLSELDAANLPADIADIPTVAEFNARTLLAASYALEATLTTINTHLADIKGTGFVKDTHSQPQCLTATGFSTHNAADVKTAMEAVGSHLAFIKAKTDALPSGIAKNVALPFLDFYMLLADGLTAATGKTVTGLIRKDNGAFAAITNVISEVGSGLYAIASGFTQAEMNADKITLKFTADACKDTIIVIYTT